MPRQMRMLTSVLGALAEELRFSARAALARDVERIEALAAEVEPEGTYPEDWIVFRITGYRPEVAELATVPGAALLADLSALAERMSELAGMTWADARAAGALDVGALCARWRVSRKTIDRLRRQGLVARRVRLDSGKIALAVMPAVVEAVERRQAGRLEQARRFSRIDEALRGAILVRAAELKAATQRLSLNGAARVIAGETGRALETVRQVLKAEDSPWAGGGSAPTEHERRLAWRAHRAGIDEARIAHRLGRNVRGVKRIIADERARMVRGIALPGWAHESAMVREAEALAALELPAVREAGRYMEPREERVVEVLRGARRADPPLGASERAMLMGYGVLVRRAAGALARAPKHGVSPRALDRAETDLRWAARIKTALVRSQAALIVRTLEVVLGERLERAAGGERVRWVLVESLSAVAEAVDAIDARADEHEGRLAAAAGLAVNRVAARARRAWTAGAPVRGARSATPITPELDDALALAPLLWIAAPWARWLEWPAWCARLIDDPRLREQERRMMGLLVGVDEPPRTLAEAARAMGLPEVRAAGLVHAASVRGRGVSRMER